MPIFSDLGLYYSGVSSPLTSPYYGSSSSYSSPSYTSRPSGGYSSGLFAPAPRLFPPRYAPLLPTISETSMLSRRPVPSRLSSPRAVVPKYLPARPIHINTADIDVSTPRSTRTECDRRDPTLGTIKRGRTVVRLHTKKLKENPALGLEKPNRKKTPGERLMEKFLIKDKVEEAAKEARRKRLDEMERLERLEAAAAKLRAQEASSTDTTPSPIKEEKAQVVSSLTEAAAFDILLSTQEEFDSHDDESADADTKTKKWDVSHEVESEIYLMSDDGPVEKCTLQRRNTVKKIRRNSQDPEALAAELEGVVGTESRSRRNSKDIEFDIEKLLPKGTRSRRSSLDVEETGVKQEKKTKATGKRKKKAKISVVDVSMENKIEAAAKSALKFVVEEVKVEETPISPMSAAKKFRYEIIVEDVDGESARASKKLAASNKKNNDVTNLKTPTSKTGEAKVNQKTNKDAKGKQLANKQLDSSKMEQTKVEVKGEKDKDCAIKTLKTFQNTQIAPDKTTTAAQNEVQQKASPIPKQVKNDVPELKHPASKQVFEKQTLDIGKDKIIPIKQDTLELSTGKSVQSLKPDHVLGHALPETTPNKTTSGEKNASGAKVVKDKGHANKRRRSSDGLGISKIKEQDVNKGVFALEKSKSPLKTRIVPKVEDLKQGKKVTEKHIQGIDKKKSKVGSGKRRQGDPTVPELSETSLEDDSSEGINFWAYLNGLNEEQDVQMTPLKDESPKHTNASAVGVPMTHDIEVHKTTLAVPLVPADAGEKAKSEEIEAKLILDCSTVTPKQEDVPPKPKGLPASCKQLEEKPIPKWKADLLAKKQCPKEHSGPKPPDDVTRKVVNTTDTKQNMKNQPKSDSALPMSSNHKTNTTTQQTCLIGGEDSSKKISKDNLKHEGIELKKPAPETYGSPSETPPKKDGFKITEKNIPSPKQQTGASSNVTDGSASTDEVAKDRPKTTLAVDNNKSTTPKVPKVVEKDPKIAIPAAKQPKKQVSNSDSSSDGVITLDGVCKIPCTVTSPKGGAPQITTEPQACVKEITSPVLTDSEKSDSKITNAESTTKNTVLVSENDLSKSKLAMPKDPNTKLKAKEPVSKVIDLESKTTNVESTTKDVKIKSNEASPKPEDSTVLPKKTKVKEVDSKLTKDTALKSKVNDLKSKVTELKSKNIDLKSKAIDLKPENTELKPITTDLKPKVVDTKLKIAEQSFPKSKDVETKSKDTSPKNPISTTVDIPSKVNGDISKFKDAALRTNDAKTTKGVVTDSKAAGPVAKPGENVSDTTQKIVDFKEKSFTKPNIPSKANGDISKPKVAVLKSKDAKTAKGAATTDSAPNSDEKVSADTTKIEEKSPAKSKDTETKAEVTFAKHLASTPINIPSKANGDISKPKVAALKPKDAKTGNDDATMDSTPKSEEKVSVSATKSDEKSSGKAANTETKTAECDDTCTDEEDESETESEGPQRASTSSDDSGFDSMPASVPGSPPSNKKDCDVNCHRKCEKLMPHLCGVNQKLIVEALTSLKRAPSSSSSEGRDPGSPAPPLASNPSLDPYDDGVGSPRPGWHTPPACTIPRFRKYTVDDFQFLKVLGKGSFGKVLLAELKGTERYYAVKCLKKDVVLEDDDVECTLIERKVLALGTKHPYLCHLFCTFQTESHLLFVMEYLNGGDLMFHIQQSGRFQEPRARFYGAEIISGLKFLHKKGIVYRDLKLDNILLDFDGHVRIADFGMCKLQIFLDRTADTFCGTPDYMAPEIIKGLKYNQCVDWWSFGILLYEMLIGVSPFSGCDEDELFWSICNEKPHFPRFLSRESNSILTKLLEKDASKRLGTPDVGDVRDQAFFRNMDWDALERRELEPPFKPRVTHPLDVQYFDKAFTAERAKLTPVEKSILQSMDQTQFQGFSYTNPNTTD